MAKFALLGASLLLFNYGADSKSSAVDFDYDADFTPQPLADDIDTQHDWGTGDRGRRERGGLLRECTYLRECTRPRKEKRDIFLKNMPKGDGGGGGEGQGEEMGMKAIKNTGGFPKEGTRSFQTAGKLARTRAGHTPNCHVTYVLMFHSCVTSRG